ncbi:hypothetical protein [Bernardetia sp.]|uniref:hypothetical protein n=1 Tax=Bernardetia sp. TaxID=1937974 RepID=UPI0025BFE389|nr:hypothetical protein [Bernardetia sp.]
MTDWLLKIKEIVWLQIFIIYTRYLIGGTFVFASLIKIKGLRFTTNSGADAPIDSAWHFFETMYQSGLYWQFLGFGQLVAGFFLMTQRYSKLGAALFYPIILNVFVITLSYEFGATPLITGLMLLANTVLLFWEWNSLRIFFNQSLIRDNPNRIENNLIWQWLGLFLFVFTTSYRIYTNKYDMFFWLGTCFLIGLSGFVAWLWKSKFKTQTV